MKKNNLGIDVGSVAISVALTDEHNRVCHTGYAFHQGQITNTLLSLLQKIDINRIKAFGYTSSSHSIIRKGRSVDSRVAYITAARHFHPEVRSLLIIGAEKYGLVTFDNNGEYSNYKSNTSCAAGTGNFLDQQAERLNLQSIHEFSKIAYENKGNIPLIASRCICQDRSNPCAAGGIFPRRNM
jgi:activator of 2-hydroxyglutaryl-CoA dehydratase